MIFSLLYLDKICASFLLLKFSYDLRIMLNEGHRKASIKKVFKILQKIFRKNLQIYKKNYISFLYLRSHAAG